MAVMLNSISSMLGECAATRADCKTPTPFASCVLVRLPLPVVFLCTYCRLGVLVPISATDGHPDVLPDEVLLIEEVLGVPPMVGTVAFGSPYVGAGLAASNNGAIAGRETTGPELNRIEDSLGLI